MIGVDRGVVVEGRCVLDADFSFTSPVSTITGCSVVCDADVGTGSCESLRLLLMLGLGEAGEPEPPDIPPIDWVSLGVGRLPVPLGVLGVETSSLHK